MFMRLGDGTVVTMSQGKILPNQMKVIPMKKSRYTAF